MLNQTQRNALPLSPASLESRRLIPAQSTCALRHLRETSISGQGSEGQSLFNLTAHRAQNSKNGQPLLGAHTGFLRPIPAAPRSSSRTLGSRPDGDKEPGPARGRPCRQRTKHPFLSHHHAPTPFRPPPAARSRDSFASCRCFVSVVKSLALELQGPNPAPKAHRCRNFRLWRRWRQDLQKGRSGT